ncbi:hypothetical protein GUITHDRAFT_155343 [Guillardia theta CCMP2712]|uniref:Uncharacterized protein n=1 Tax=Guillardia theta (strain CCMP2712) TaxID=905079 RepID=L1IJQ9_GUITC|nr:hypothetical protein GUITHDRAFT_155343 [Guillardia theta CCMP2712]EKX36045.1 hypothetical protein GUITHDRAFT_155343 [Guillardia theta CCMP2712]|eukprot:XP_005823025.1 hypothetical protein GUITHDRAFT_155343 [Guillardia theta CCMP2712]
MLRYQLLLALLVSTFLGAFAFQPLLPQSTRALKLQRCGVLQLASQAFKPQKTQWIVRKASSMSFLPQQTQKIDSSSLRNFHVHELSNEQRRRKVMDLVLAIGARDATLGSAMAAFYLLLGYSPSHFPVSIWLLSCIAVRIMTEDNGFPGWVMDHLNKETDESSWSMSWRDRIVRWTDAPLKPKVQAEVQDDKEKDANMGLMKYALILFFLLGGNSEP